MKNEIYKDRYDFEWNHRNHLHSALQIPIALATLLGGAIAFLVQKFPYKDDTTTYIFVLIISLGIISLLTGIYYLIRSIKGVGYYRLPTPLKIKKHYDDLLKWRISKKDTQEDAERDLENFINLRLSEAVEKNANTNQNRAAYIYKSNTSFTYTLIILFIATIPYLFANISTDEKIYKIEIVSANQ